MALPSNLIASPNYIFQALTVLFITCDIHKAHKKQKKPKSSDEQSAGAMCMCVFVYSQDSFFILQSVNTECAGVWWNVCV